MLCPPRVFCTIQRLALLALCTARVLAIIDQDKPHKLSSGQASGLSRQVSYSLKGYNPTPLPPDEVDEDSMALHKEISKKIGVEEEGETTKEKERQNNKEAPAPTPAPTPDKERNAKERKVDEQDHKDTVRRQQIIENIDHSMEMEQLHDQKVEAKQVSKKVSNGAKIAAATTQRLIRRNAERQQKFTVRQHVKRERDAKAHVADAGKSTNTSDMPAEMKHKFEIKMEIRKTTEAHKALAQRSSSHHPIYQLCKQHTSVEHCQKLMQKPAELQVPFLHLIMTLFCFDVPCSW